VVPEHPFVRGVLNCSNVKIEYGCQHLVAAEYSVQTAMTIISLKSPIVDDEGGSIRVPPLVLSRLGRGGKTTMLHVLFNQLKASGKYAPIYISFNGGFHRFPENLMRMQFFD